jgi:F like protein
MRGSARLLRLYSKQDPVEAERARIEELLSGYSRFVRQQFDLFVNSTQNPAVLSQIETAIRDGRIADALNIVDTYAVRFADNVVSQVSAIGMQEAEALAEQSGLARAGVAVSFNPTSPEVVAAVNRNRLEFIQNLTTDQRLTVNAALMQAARDGAGPEEAARAMRDSIGLTSYQQQMVVNYRRALESNSRDALDRVLRDRRYDRGFENAIEAGEVLPEARIDTMVDRYRQRLLQLRGETIARTEALRVGETTRNISVYQAADRAGTPYSQVVKQWMATRDKRTRETHAAMDGQARLLEDNFDSPSGAALAHPGDSDAPAEEIISCRCTTAYHFFETADEAAKFLAENGQGRYDGT